MTSVKRLIGIMILMLWPTSSLWAAKQASLYTAEVPVASQAEDERTEAIKQGMLQVLIKISGNGQIEKNPLIKHDLQRAAYYVQEYSYGAVAPNASQYLLEMRFEAEDIDRLLKKAGIANWGETRPLILAWIAVANEDENIEIMSNEMVGSRLKSLAGQAKFYGLPLIFPIMDAADLEQVSSNDIISLDISAMQAASKRYMPEALLLGSIFREGENYKSEWRLKVGDFEWRDEIASATVDTLMVTVIDRVKQALSQHNQKKEVPQNTRWITLEVNNISKPADLARLMKYLSKMTDVAQVQLMEVVANSVSVSVELKGNVAAFTQYVSLGQYLKLINEDEDQHKLVYEWMH